MSGPAKRENLNIHTRRIVCERGFEGAFQTRGREHCLIERENRGRLQRVGAMMDPTLEYLAVRMCIEEISFDEEMFETARPRRLDLAARRSPNQV